MTQRRARTADHKSSAAMTSSIQPPMEPGLAYEMIMGTVRGRLLILDVQFDGEGSLNKAERLALHIRKIVEAVSFAALSASEYTNSSQLLQQRTKDASQVLAWLKHKKLLRLPEAQRVVASTDPQYSTVCEGNPSVNLSAEDLQGMFSRASALIHERHPERLSQERLAIELQQLEKDAVALRHWLWSHIVFLRDAGFLIQMGMFGKPNFMRLMTRELPSA